MKSTLYVKCIECNETALIQEIQGKYICANCNFDYTSLKDDARKLDEFLVNNLREGVMGKVMALEMHRLITLMPNVESIEYVKSLALKNGIKLPDAKKGFFSRLFGRSKG